MMTEVLAVVLFSGVLIGVCWMLAEYWMGARDRVGGEETEKLRFGSRTAFALTHFWDTVDEAGDIPKKRLEKEMSLVNRAEENHNFREAQYSMRQAEHTKEMDMTKKKYKMKENM